MISLEIAIDNRQFVCFDISRKNEICIKLFFHSVDRFKIMISFMRKISHEFNKVISALILFTEVKLGKELQ